MKKPLKTHKSTPKHHYIGKRKYNIIHTRIRLDCSDLNFHKYKMHLQNNSLCPQCNNCEENVNHYFFECPKYTVIRDIMIQDIINMTYGEINIDCNLMLYGHRDLDFETNSNIFKSVQNYIELSKRFVF